MSRFLRGGWFPIKKARNEILRFSLYVQIRCWQRAIFPGGGPPSIVTSVSLYDRVRDGNGWFPYDLSPTNFRLLFTI